MLQWARNYDWVTYSVPCWYGIWSFGFSSQLPFWQGVTPGCSILCSMMVWDLEFRIQLPLWQGAIPGRTPAVVYAPPACYTISLCKWVHTSSWHCNGYPWMDPSSHAFLYHRYKCSQRNPFSLTLCAASCVKSDCLMGLVLTKVVHAYPQYSCMQSCSYFATYTCMPCFSVYK